MPSTLVVDRTSATPVHLQIRQHLTGVIRSMREGGEDRLPSLNSLARQYGITYTTAHRITRDLENEGLITAVKGRGLFIRKVPGRAARADELRLSCPNLYFRGDDEAYLQNAFHRAAPGTRLVLGSSEPDIVVLTGDEIPAKAGELEDVSDVIREVYGRPADEPDMFGILQAGGKSAVMPVHLNTVVAVCNLDLLESRGIPLPSSDWTWDDLIRVARGATSPAEGNYGYYPTGLEHIFPAMIWQNGGRIFSEDGKRSLLDSDEAVAAAERLRQLAAYAPADRRPEDVDDDGMVHAFADGRIAVVLHNRYFPEALRRAGSRVRWAALPLPRGEKRVSIVHTVGFGLRRGSPAGAAAREFFRLVGGWEKWPQKASHYYGIRLHADMDRHDATEAVFRSMFSCGRTPLSDIRPDCRSQRQSEASALLNPMLERILRSREPVLHLLRESARTVDAMLSMDDILSRPYTL